MNDDIIVENDFLIQLVRERPILWDKTLDDYRHKQRTYNAWKDICLLNFEHFQTFSEKEKRHVVKVVVKRWSNIRDNWMKSHKKILEWKACGKSPSSLKIHKYKYYEEVKFLEKVAMHRFSDDEDDNTDKRAELEERYKKIKHERPTEKSVPSTTQSDTLLDKKMMIVLNESIEHSQSRIMSFFKSIAPTVDKLSDENIVDFQYEVMRTLKTIKSRNEEAETSQQWKEESYSITSTPNGDVLEFT